MKFWAKVTFRWERNAEHLIRAFFKEFNPDSSIVIRGKNANVEIVFEKMPPLEIVEAISHCDIVGFNFGKNIEEYSGQEMKEETFEQFKQEEKKESFEQVKQEEKTETFEPFEEPLEEISEMPYEVMGEENQVEENQSEESQPDENQPEENEPEKVVESEEIEKEKDSKVEASKKKRAKSTDKEVEHKKKRGKSTTKKAEPKKDRENEEVNLPKLEEFAQKVSSFEKFVNAVATWLEMDKRQEFFVNLAIMASEVEKITWKSLLEGLENKGISCSQWDKIWTTSQISEKLKDENVTILPLLKAIAKYKNFSFISESSEKEIPKQESVIEEKRTDNDVKIKCASENSSLEDILSSVDKTQPIEDRVRYVLDAMGLKAKSELEQQQIFEFANTAVRVERMNYDIIFLKANIPMEESMNARMTLSTFVNDFVKKYDSNKKVKVLDFLKQMQENIMHSDEIERFDDFSE